MLRQSGKGLRQGGEGLRQGDEVLRQCGETRHQMMTLSSNQQRSVHKSHNFATYEYYSAEDSTDIGAQKNHPEGGGGKTNIMKILHFLIVVAKHSACFPIFLLCILNWSVDVYISAQGTSSPLTQPDPLSASASQQITQRACPLLLLPSPLQASPLLRFTNGVFSRRHQWQQNEQIQLRKLNINRIRDTHYLL